MIWDYFHQTMHQEITSRGSRANPRQPALKKAVIEFNGAAGAVATSCTVRNLSETGACIGAIAPPGIPDHFDLVMPNDDSRRACRVVWRKSKQNQTQNRTSIQLGVAFQ